MEHLSRRTTRDVQHLLVITDPSQRGIVAAERIAQFRRELDIRIENAYLIVNRLEGDLPKPLGDQITRLELPLLGVVPADPELSRFEYNGRPLIELESNSPVYQAVAGMMKQIM